MAGIWERKSTGAYFTTIRGRQLSLGKNKENAEKKFHELMLAPQTISDRTTLNREVLSQFLNHIELKTKGGRTFKWYRHFLTKFGEYAGHLKISELKGYVLEDFIESVYGKKSDNTKNSAARAVKQCFSWLYKRNAIYENPFKAIKPVSGTSREAIITVEQYNALLALIKDERLLDITKFLALTGCRPEEARILKSKWLDTKSKVKTIVIPKGEYAKGKKSARTIVLTPEAFEIAERLAKQNPDGFIFLNSQDNQWQNQALLDRFAVLRKKTGFYVSPYVFRHFFATRALESGIDGLTVAALMGNKLKTIEKYYSKMPRNKNYLSEQLTKMV